LRKNRILVICPSEGAVAMEVPGFQIKELLYDSRNSRVYRADRLRDGLPVVLKLLSDHPPSPERRARFQQEYNLMHKLHEDGVLTAHGLESHQGNLVMILEDFGGKSLNNLQVAGALALDQWLQLAIRITGCLGQLHRRHVMHKDVNPSNIVWNRQTGQVKLIDLGISTELSREVPAIRNPDRLEGTLSYLSPEQTGRMNRALDYRTDFYSLGVTLYELLTGWLPFPTGDVLELVHAHIARTPLSAEQVNAAIPSVVSGIIAKLMAKTAEDRYQSAAGLEADLQTCLQTLDTHGQIPMFVLGAKDFSERLQISQRLYGREKQIETLLDAFNRASTGNAELLLVAGYSGVGKSSLVHEVQKPITRHRGYFIEGKFEQFKRDIPYASLVQAFNGLIRQILTEGEAVVMQWKTALMDALGSNGHVVTDVIPELEFIIGAQVPVLELPAEQAKNRFNQEFRKFVKVFASSEHPLVIFLDDLQWADLASLQLMSSLLRAQEGLHLLVIGAYRDNEISPAHPLPLVLKQAEQHGAAIRTITLPPLDLDETGRLLSDTLHATATDARNLARLCMAKTQGNPFFLSQFLMELADQKILYFDTGQGRWRWDLPSIQRTSITDNIVDLMITKLQKLPLPTQHVLEGAACLGNVFDLKTLAVVCGLSEARTSELLWDALREELVIPLDDYYKYAGQFALDDGMDLIPAYRFLHDRVQQAAYMLNGVSEKSAMHLAIGRLWLQSFSDAEQHAMLFDLVNHLNLGRGLIRDGDERQRLAQLNASAAQRAKLSSAYRPALGYLQIALELVGEEDWRRRYDFMLALHLNAAEAAYLSIDFAQMERCLAVALEHAANVLDQAKVHEIRIQAYISEDRFKEAIQRGLEVLRLLGIVFPEAPTQLHIIGSLVHTRLALGGKKIEDLAQLPDMTDPGMLAVSNILLKVFAAAYYAKPVYMPLLLFKAIRLSLRYGHAPSSPFFYAAYGMVLGGAAGDIKKGAVYGELALRLQERPATAVNQCRAMFVYHFTILPWNRPLHQVLAPLLDDYVHGVKIGDMEFSANAALGYCVYAFACGHGLAELVEKTANYCHAIEQMQRPSALYMQKMQWQTISNLMGDAPDPSVMEGKVIDHRQLQELHRMVDDQILMYNLLSLKAMLCYFFQDYREALRNTRLAMEYVEAVVGMFGTYIVYFYGSLARLAILKEFPAAERTQMLREVVKNQKKLRHWADHAPFNFLHKWYLVEAELARCKGDALTAIDAYEHAIRCARENGFPQEEALAKELAGKFYLGRRQDIVARSYLTEAYHDYHRWGALAKARDLARRYPQWLRENEHDHASGATAYLQKTISLTSISTSGALDFATVMKATQALSQEIVLERLLKRLMQVVIENAGAQRGVLLLKKQGRWFIEAEKEEEDAQATVLQSLLLDEAGSDGVRLPLSLVHYVARTGESVVIHEAATEKLLESDSYIQRYRPRSMLAVPILHQGEMTGMLYLENNAVSGAFTEKRLEVLHLLASQTAISIENARLYADMEERVAARTFELKALSLRDTLTGVANRKAFDERLIEEMARARRNSKPLSLLMIDIDHFKRVNDAYGHPVGDECLRRVGAILTEVTHRMNDFVARYGGEEFVVVLPATDLDGALLFAERILDAVRTIVLEVGEIRHPITASIGLATAEAGAHGDAAALVACADQRLYAAKAGGRNRIVGAEADLAARLRE
jgi:diguanylate cyclase (GGDEF)-like protein